MVKRTSTCMKRDTAGLDTWVLLQTTHTLQIIGSSHKLLSVHVFFLLAILFNSSLPMNVNDSYT